MSVSGEINELVNVLIEGLDEISKWHYHQETNPFESLQKKIREELNSFQKLGFRSNKKNTLFREEIKTMTAHMKSRLEVIKKLSKRTPKKSYLSLLSPARDTKLEKEQMHHFYLVGALPTMLPSDDDSLIEKFLKNSLTLIKSLKNLCGTKFSQFFEVLEEIFEVFLVELF